MKKTGRKLRLSAVAIAAASIGILSGCASTPAVPAIDRDWVARIPPERMQPVEEARRDWRQAQDSVARARLAVGDAERSLAVYRAQEEAAEAQVFAAKKQVEAARAQGNAGGVNDAIVQQNRAERGLHDARRQIGAVAERIDYARARAELAEAREVRTGAEVRYVEYQVLRDQGDLRVRQIPAAEFEKSINQLARRESQLEQKVRKEAAEADAAQRQVGR